MKKRSIQIPSFLRDVLIAVIMEKEGKEYTSLKMCPHCGGSVSGYDSIIRNYAALRVDGQVKKVNVIVGRFYCNECGRLCSADSPFYPGTRHGRDIVDIAAAFSSTMSYSRAATVMKMIGIIIDRGTVRNYVQKEISRPVTTEMFGYPIPVRMVQGAAASFMAGINQG